MTEGKVPSEARTVRLVPSISIASITAIICVVILVYPISLKQVLPTKLLSGTLSWDGVEIEYTWISTKAVRKYGQDILDAPSSETLTFAKGVVRNTARTDLRVTRAALMLTDKNGIAIGRLSYSESFVVEPGESTPIELEGWILTALIADVSGLSGRLAFSHDDR